VGLLRQISAPFCEPPPTFNANTAAVAHTSQAFTSSLSGVSLGSPPPSLDVWSDWIGSWSADSCVRIVTLAQLTCVASVVAATLLQFVGALQVREYARQLWLREMMEEEERGIVVVGEGRPRMSFAEEAGLPVIFEDDEKVRFD